MAALFTVLLGASALMLAFFLYQFGQNNLIRETEAVIDAELTHILSSDLGDTSTERARSLETHFLRLNNTYLAYLTYGQDIIVSSFPKLPENVSTLTEGIIEFPMQIDGKAHHFAAKIHSFEDGTRLLVARDIQPIISSFNKLQIVSAIIIGFMLIVILVSFFISTFVVSRINRIGATAQKIMATGDLSRRIEIDSNWDDLSSLGMVLNEFLDRNQELIENVRTVADNIAHDLRTPLTRLRNHLEDLKHSNLPKEQQEQLINEADHLLATFNSLLRIANIERGKRHQDFRSFNLTELIQDLCELYDPVAEEKNIKLLCNLPTHITVTADRDLLFQFWANLMDNAVKFSKENGQIRLQIGVDQQGHTQAILTDTGTGIPEKDLGKIFNRFYRAEQSRHTKGNGLGLSLVKAIADLHKLKLQYQNVPNGLEITVTLDPILEIKNC